MHTPARSISCANFAVDVARFIVEQARIAIQARNAFRLALAGGETPRAIHRELVQFADQVPWEKFVITFGDERCVPPNDAQSNYAMALSSLLEHVSILPENVLRMRGEIEPEVAAQEYETELAARAAGTRESRYVHDLILLGMGPDGHTASLFPGSPALDETQRNVVPAIGPKPPPQRLTFTFPLINSARHVCFLVNDAAKRPIVDEILAGRSSLPAARVQPIAGEVTWLVGAGS